MSPENILTLLTHGGPLATTGLLFWLYWRERTDRISAETREREAAAAAQELILGLTREISAATASVVHSNEANTTATTALSEHVRGVGEKMSTLIRRRAP